MTTDTQTADTAAPADTGAATPATGGDTGGTATDNTAADNAADTKVSTESNNADGTENPNADGNKTEGDGSETDGKDAEGKADGQDGTDGAYADFTLPEGFEMDTEALAEFAPVAKQHNLSQEAAQQFIDMHANAIQNAVTRTADELAKNEEFREQVFTDMQTARLDKWADAAISDEDVGGEKSKEALSTALKAVEALDKDVPGLLELVSDPEIGLGSHVKAVKFFEKLGRHIVSQGFQAGNAGGGNTKRAADTLYGNNQNQK